MDGLHFLPDILAAAAAVVAEAAVPAVAVFDAVVVRWFQVLVASASQKEQKKNSIETIFPFPSVPSFFIFFFIFGKRL